MPSTISLHQYPFLPDFPPFYPWTKFLRRLVPLLLLPSKRATNFNLFSFQVSTFPPPRPQYAVVETMCPFVRCRIVRRELYSGGER